MQQFDARRARLRAAVLAGGLAVGLSLLVASPAHAIAEPVVTATATPATAQVGDPIDVAVDVTGLADVYSYSITLAFDPTLVDYVADSATAGPAGGFDTVEQTAGTVTLVHTRLGTSPPFTGDLPEALGFIATGSGPVTFTVSIALVDGAGVSTPFVNAAASAPVAISPAPVVVDPGTTPGTGDTPASTNTPAVTTRNADGSLAFTGFTGGAMVIFASAVALAIIIAGAVLLVVRRRTASAR